MRKKTQYIVVNEIYKTIYCGYPQKRAWKIITGSSGGMLRLLWWILWQTDRNTQKELIFRKESQKIR